MGRWAAGDEDQELLFGRATFEKPGSRHVGRWVTCAFESAGVNSGKQPRLERELGSHQVIGGT